MSTKTDPIRYGNDVALEANRIDITNFTEQRGLPLCSQGLEIVHNSVYDSFGGTSPKAGLEPYLKEFPGPEAGASTDAVVAAHPTLSSLFPGHRVLATRIIIGLG